MSASVGSVMVPAAELRVFAAAVAQAVGMPADDAETVAEGMVWADLRGVDIGIKRLPMLVDRIRQGGTIANPKPVVLRESTAFAVLDGRGAWGMVAAARAMRIAISKAHAGGLGACVVRDTGNSQAMGYYPWLAVQEGLIGLAITNSLALQAPWGGTERVLGNQAYAIGCPGGRHDPVIFDGASTAISWVGIHGYEARGEPLPAGVALNVRGEPTTDPVEALAGLLLPAGGYKGFGLALMWEILTGVLSGGDAFGPSVNGGRDAHERSGQSTFLLALDPSASLPHQTFLNRVDTLIDLVHASPTAPGVERVVVPGERSGETAQEREQQGIPLQTERIAELARLARDLGVQLPPALTNHRPEI